MADNTPSRVDANHAQFADKMIKALEAGTAPWQKPWAPGERISPQDFSTSRDYRGGNAIYLAVAEQKRAIPIHAGAGTALDHVGHGQHVLLYLGREAQQVYDLGHAGPGEAFSEGDLSPARSLAGLQEGLSLDGLAQEFDGSGCIGRGKPYREKRRSG